MEWTPVVRWRPNPCELLFALQRQFRKERAFETLATGLTLLEGDRRLRALVERQLGAFNTGLHAARLVRSDGAVRETVDIDAVRRERKLQGLLAERGSGVGSGVSGEKG